MSNRANRRLRRQEQRSNKAACQPCQEVRPSTGTHPRLIWSAVAILAVLATVLALHNVSRAAVSAASSTLAPISKQALAPAETPPNCVIAHEGDVNARWLRAVRMKVDADQITLFLRDDATGALFTLKAPKGAHLPRKDDGQPGGDLVLARLSTLPEHMDLERFAFSTRPIETVQEGQQVVSRDPQTGMTEIKTVSRTFEHKATEIVVLELANAQTGLAADRLRGTPEHPFFTPDGIVPMGKLEAGSKVITRAGTTLVVKSTKRDSHPEGISVCNFEVEDDHTYFVGAANGGTWVHNTCAAGGLPDFSGKALSEVEGHLGDAGFVEKPLQPGSTSPYRTFTHADGSKVSIDTANKVIKVNGPKQWTSDMSQKFSPRFGPHDQPFVEN